jgi:hypothetical protein
MRLLIGLLPAATDPNVTPGPGGTGGFLGFVVTFLLAGALIALVLSLTRQLRKIDRNARAAALSDDPTDEAPTPLPTPPTAAATPSTSTTSEQVVARGHTSSDVGGDGSPRARQGEPEGRERT